MKIENKLLDGFSPHAIRNTLPCSKSWGLSYQPEASSKVQAIFKQPFYYLSSGSQSFVFLSQDRKFVLKFFKNDRWEIPLYYEWLSKFSTFIDRKIKEKKEGERATYQSCFFSYTQFQKETALNYLQLDSHQGPFKVSIFDSLGKPYQLNLSDVPFALQRKITLTHERWLQYLSHNELNSLKNLVFEDLDKLMTFLITLKKQGYTHKDPHFLMNFGFENDEPICIDIGGFTFDPTKSSKHFYESDLKKIQKKLYPWFERHLPLLKKDLKAYFQSFYERRDHANDPFVHTTWITNSYDSLKLISCD